MVAEAVEKMQKKKKKKKGKSTEKESCYTFYSPPIQTYSHKHFILK